MDKTTAYNISGKKPDRFLSVLVVVFLNLFSLTLFANNISVSNISLTGQNTTDHFILVQFDISWNNSWRGSTTSVQCTNNWDAAWVFIKYRVSVANGGDGLWKHAWLHATGWNAPTGSTISVGLYDPKTAFDVSANPGLGAFLYRDAAGSGTFSRSGVQLRWNYGTNGVADGAVGDITDIKVLAIEMVAVPQGSFNLGSGGTEAAPFYTYPATTAVYPVNSEAAIQVGPIAGNLYYLPGGSTGDGAGPIPASFPKGYIAFYSMKHEILQQEYVDFLNTLTFAQQTTRTLLSPVWPPGTGAVVASNQYRNGIDIMISGVNPTTPAVYACNLTNDLNYSNFDDGQWIPCDNLGWADVTAFLDWCGLRPLTELEFEKSCRGTLASQANEFVWGTTTISGIKITLSNAGQNSELIDATAYSTTSGNADFNITVPYTSVNRGPVRAGCFFDNPANNSRKTAGATYYGIQEMGGNVTDRTITIGNFQGRAYTGLHGNGHITATGEADITQWPSSSDAVGAGFRGGAWGTTSTNLRISDRQNAAFTTMSRSLNYGGRGVRSVPPLTIDLNEPAPICAGDPLSFTAVLTGTPPWNFTLTDGTNSYVQSNITTTPYTFSIIPPPVVTTTYWILEITDALGFDYTPQDTVTVYVSAVPVILDLNVVICTGGTFSVTPVHGGGNIVPPGTTYTWSDPVSSPPGAVTGGSAQATGVGTISQTLVNTTYSTATLTYTVTPTSPCPGVPAGTPFTITVTVNPKPAPVSIYHY